MAIPNAAPHRERTALDAEDVAAALLDRAWALSMVLSLIATNSHQVTRAAAIVVEALAGGHLVVVCGNGGSAAVTPIPSNGDSIGGTLPRRW